MTDDETTVCVFSAIFFFDDEKDGDVAGALDAAKHVPQWNGKDVATSDSAAMKVDP